MTRKLEVELQGRSLVISMPLTWTVASRIVASMITGLRPQSTASGKVVLAGELCLSRHRRSRRGKAVFSNVSLLGFQRFV